MKPETSERAFSLYESALELDEAQRGAFLERECAGAPALHRMVKRMLGASEAPTFLEPEALAGVHAQGGPEPASLASPPTDVAGQAVGPFRLLRTIGAGGMGVVYEAEQDYPRRRVALKRLRGDLLLDSGVRRFRSEIELLARLEHPGVARIHEAGVHRGADGVERPYFAMEFVEGARDLLTWAEGRPLSERLARFLDVCDAVQHGHQRGVIHRDLKPQNVLVSSGGAVKVIDFGVARAVDADGAAATRATRAGDLVGTLAYMAPEQLAGDEAAVDTRTDVHALGLLLFELVYSRPPYDLADKPLTEVARILREVPPLSPRQLGGDAPRDLGWIALRALEKEPDRRYASVSELAGDVRRFLDDRPIEAGPPSRLATLVKFVRRNTLAVAAAALVVTALAIGGAVSFASLVHARTESDKFQTMNEVLTDLFVAVRAEEDGYDVRAAALLERAAEGLARFEDRPEIEAPLRGTLAKSYFGLGLPREAETEARRALALRAHLSPDEERQAATHLGQSLLRLDRDDEAREVVDRYLSNAGTPPRADSAPLFPLRQLDAQLLLRAGEPRSALERLRALVDDARGVHGVDARSTRNYELSLARALFEEERFAEAAELLAGVRERAERLAGPRAPTTLAVRAEEARALSRLDRLEAAARLQEALLPEMVAVFGETSSRTLVALNDLANTYVLLGESARALPLLEEVVRLRTERDGPEHSETLTAKSSLAVALAALGDGRAEELRVEGFESRRRVLGPDHLATLRAQFALGRYLRQAGRLDEAEPLLADLHERSVRVYLDDDLPLHDAAAELAMLLFARGRTDEAALLLGQAWRGYQRRAEPEAALTLVLGNNYATALMNLERWEDAQAVLTEVLASMRAQLPDDDPRQLGAMFNLAIVHERRGEAALGERRLREALAWSERHLEPQDPRRIHVRKGLADLLAEQERHDEALDEYDRALAASELSAAVDAEERAALRLGRARSLRAAARPDEAAAELALVVDLERTRLGPDDAAVQALVAELAAVRAEAAPASSTSD